MTKKSRRGEGAIPLSKNSMGARNNYYRGISSLDKRTARGKNSHILAIDPGSRKSAFVYYSLLKEAILDKGLSPNDPLAERLQRDPLWLRPEKNTVLVIEQVKSYGGPANEDLYTTAMWSGQFVRAWHPRPLVWLPRKSIVNFLGLPMTAGDPQVRQAMIDYFGGLSEKRPGGSLVGVKYDIWSALAAAVAYKDNSFLY